MVNDSFITFIKQYPSYFVIHVSFINEIPMFIINQSRPAIMAYVHNTLSLV
jgi:hypothetical protein